MIEKLIDFYSKKEFRSWANEVIDILCALGLFFVLFVAPIVFKID